MDGWPEFLLALRVRSVYNSHRVENGTLYISTSSSRYHSGFSTSCRGREGSLQRLSGTGNRFQTCQFPTEADSQMEEGAASSAALHLLISLKLFLRPTKNDRSLKRQRERAQTLVTVRGRNRVESSTRQGRPAEDTLSSSSSSQIHSPLRAALGMLCRLKNGYI